jgi:hypothetical protein
MKLPMFQETVLRRGEILFEKIQRLLKKTDNECYDIAYVANMCFCSSATNDYYEKIGAESIGFVHQTAKHGADGLLNGVGCEIKPTKGSAGIGKLGVINDDSPMKLLKDHRECQWLVALRIAEDGSRVHWAIVVPFSYWEQSRFEKIVKKLDIVSDSDWKWGSTLPMEESERIMCLEALVQKHKKDHYVRSNELKATILSSIPKEQRCVWIHPDQDLKKVNAAIRNMKT